jgi:hypothetical protein
MSRKSEADRVTHPERTLVSGILRTFSAGSHVESTEQVVRVPALRAT